MNGSLLGVYQTFRLEILPCLRKYHRVNSKVRFEVTYIDCTLLSIDAGSLHPHKSEPAAHHLIGRVNKKNHVASKRVPGNAGKGSNRLGVVE